jgi:hypothetical protein
MLVTMQMGERGTIVGGGGRKRNYCRWQSSSTYSIEADSSLNLWKHEPMGKKMARRWMGRGSM